MGNCAALSIEWKFVGRDAEMKKVKELLNKKRSVLVFGMRKIGKSKFTEELYRELCKSENYKCVIKDFESDDIESGHTIYNWFIEFFISIDADKERERFINQYPSETIACNSCENCQLPDRDKCLKRNDLIKKAINSLIDTLGNCKSEFLLFLDNIDKIMDSPLKDNFLHFHRQSLKCLKLRTVLASANKPKQTTRNYVSFELKPLDKKAILEILFETTEQRENDLEDEEHCSETVTYSPELKVFKKENKPYIDALVGLCEGLPLAAIMSGMLLTEDDCLLTPANLVEILICMRLTSLSPDNCPPDDRLEIYKHPMEEVKGVATFFNCLNENMTGTEFSIDQAVAAASDASDGVETEAMVKHNVLKKALDRSVLSIQSLSGTQQLNWHGIFRECQAALKALDSIPSGDDTAFAKDMVLKFMKENVVKAGLEFDEEVLSNPKSLEFAIKSLSCKEKTPPPIQVMEDDEAVRMSLLKEHHLASKKAGTTEFETKQLPVMKTHKGVEHYKSVENSPHNDSRKNKKLATRYSVSEGSDSSDSDSLNLQFTNINLRQTEGSMMNDVNGITNGLHSRSPPPYTSQPGPLETTAPCHNQNGGDGNQFRPINTQFAMNSVGEPPPCYTSTDPIRFVQGMSSDARRQYADNALPHNNSDSVNLYEIRSRSLPSVNSRSYNFQVQQHNQENTRENSYQVNHRRQANNDNPNFHRAGSDPTFNRPVNNAARQLVDYPRREVETSVSDSLTGPPAMNYIPPNIQFHKMVHNHQADGHHATQHLRVHPNTDMSRQASGLRIAIQKEPMTDTHVDHTSVQSGFSSQGPADISYKQSLNNDLSVDQENFNQVSHIPSFQSDASYHVRHFGESPQRLLVTSSKNETKRRSPTAIVSPMPKRRSPPNINKQLQNEPGIATVAPSDRSNKV
ncbi:uncharacterized protein LOC123551687 [Mercenaria mercenaria]|uniref:uncharacterized protein LOC123551687 n=1 Tax=Mercenaria mercenaria TaxID=6596 RepID=UPI00234E9E08|nr:uncharacterized protein LOC123551687 [Mercenaria mercenaria]XP_053397131.1 uncharacterized protein LOC123551687 [Mercenaria mercenaria]XP_053397132.1 uncharacterized protein LOC123551687 [Mercenaria mercenaria]XP_053397133.1 uncharacterized protein LOC123551687 [Mercenaria mercenaria]XP_053397134.1 uncharacterized protein LOC123551687 [Mercenaria mercenaria]